MKVTALGTAPNVGARGGGAGFLASPPFFLAISPSTPHPLPLHLPTPAVGPLADY